MPSSYSGNDVFPSAADIPSDGDAKDVSSVNVSLEAVLDRTTWLKNRSNDLWYYNNNVGGGDPSLIETHEYNVIGTTWTKSAVILKDIPSCVAFDQLFCRLHIGGIIAGGGSGVPLVSYRLYSIQDYGGAAIQAAVPGSQAAFGLDANDPDYIVPIHTAGRVSISTNGTCRIGLEIRLRLASAGFQAQLYNGVHLEIQRIKF